MVMAVDRVSETVAVTLRPSYTQTSVYSQCEVVGHKRHKQEITLRPVLAPVKYADTAYLYINNTRKRYVSRTYYEPRIRPKSFADTTYANPKAVQERFVSFLDAHTDKLKSWYKTSIEIRPKKFKSSFSHPNNAHSVSSTSSVTGQMNGSSHPVNGVCSPSGFNDSDDLQARGNVDENMNERIPSPPVFQEKYDPGASQVYIPKSKDLSFSNNESLLDSISDQILVNGSNLNGLDQGYHNGYANLNGHISGVSDL